MTKHINKSNKSRGDLFIMLAFWVASICTLLPFLLVLSASFSLESDIDKYGYLLIPKKVVLDAYNYIFRDPTQILNSYIVTIIVTLVSTVVGVFIMAMFAYAISREIFWFRKQLNFMLFFTMLFSGGLVPTYILVTQYLKLADNILALILPNLVVPFYVFILRAFFQGAPASIIESAKIDGAGEFKTLMTIIFPISLPAIATVSFMMALFKWNDWFNGLLYIRSDNLLPLQTMLQRILLNIQALTSGMFNPQIVSTIKVPQQSVMMAMLVLAAGPMLFIFPFFQKYFISGLTVGAVKG